MEVKARMIAFGHATDQYYQTRLIEIPDDKWEGSSDGQRFEYIFYYGQNDFQPKQTPSLSVGDVVEYENRLMLCMPTDWEEITQEEFEKALDMDQDKRCMWAYHLEKYREEWNE